jgi:hypothetical protein
MTGRLRMVDGQHVDSGEWEAHGPIRIFASGNARVFLYGPVRAWASHLASIISSNGAAFPVAPDIVAADESLVSVAATEHVVSIGHEHGNPLIIGGGRARIEAYGWSVVEVEEHVAVRAHGRSSLSKPGIGDLYEGRVELHDRAGVGHGIAPWRVVRR